MIDLITHCCFRTESLASIQGYQKWVVCCQAIEVDKYPCNFNRNYDFKLFRIKKTINSSVPGEKITCGIGVKGDASYPGIIKSINSTHCLFVTLVSTLLCLKINLDWNLLKGECVLPPNIAELPLWTTTDLASRQWLKLYYETTIPGNLLWLLLISASSTSHQDMIASNNTYTNWVLQIMFSALYV